MESAIRPMSPETRQELDACKRRIIGNDPAFLMLDMILSLATSLRVPQIQAQDAHCEHCGKALKDAPSAGTEQQASRNEPFQAKPLQ